MRSIALAILFVFWSCENHNSSESRSCVSAKEVGIQFSRPFSFNKTDTLQIDELKFTHVDYLDSLVLGNYLPNENPVIVEINGKQARENSNEITIGRALARNLLQSGRYEIRNSAELLTSGKLKVIRKDGQKIKICIPEDYSAVLFENKLP